MLCGVEIRLAVGRREVAVLGPAGGARRFGPATGPCDRGDLAGPRSTRYPQLSNPSSISHSPLPAVVARRIRAPRHTCVLVCLDRTGAGTARSDMETRVPAGRPAQRAWACTFCRAKGAGVCGAVGAYWSHRAQIPAAPTSAAPALPTRGGRHPPSQPALHPPTAVSKPMPADPGGRPSWALSLLSGGG